MHRAEPRRTRRGRPYAPNRAYRAQSPGRQAPESCLFFAPWRLRVKLFPGPSGKPANPRPTTHVPFPTSTRLCHKARGCAGRRTTPGPGHITFPTPKGVVPSFRLGSTPRERHGTYLRRRNPALFVTVTSVVFVDSVGTTALPIACQPLPTAGVASNR